MHKATLTAQPEITSLWMSVFRDSETFVKKFIAHFGIENCYVYDIEDKIVAMAFAMQNSQLSILNSQFSILNYVYACATHPDYRRQGIMQKLLEKIYEDACNDNIAGIFLRAANEDLANYYRKLEFEDYFYRDCFVFNRKGRKEFAKDARDICFDSQSLRPLRKPLRPLRLKKYCQKRTHLLSNESFINWNEDFFNFLKEDNITFYEYENSILAFSKSEKKIIVEELLGTVTPSEIANLLFEQYPNIETIEIRTPGNNHCCGQVKWCTPINLSSGYFAFAMDSL